MSCAPLVEELGLEAGGRESLLSSAARRQSLVAITGLGTAAPMHSIAQEDAAQLAADLGVTRYDRKLLAALYRRSGVRKRHSVVLDEANGQPERQTFYPVAAGPEDHGPGTARRMEAYEASAANLAVQACQSALEHAEIRAGSITHLVTASCSGFAAPGVDLALIERLQLSRDVQRVHVGFMGCHGALNALRAGSGWVAADPGARVLVCAVELCSLHQQYTDDPQQLVANALFSDGAAALVLERAAGEADCRVVSQGSHVIAGTSDLMSWKIGDHGFLMTLSPKVPDVIKATLKPWLRSWLAREGYELDDIRSWAVHPGGPRILKATAEALDLPQDALQHSTAILESYGNMSSPTVMFIYDRIRRLTEQGPTVLLGFGPGLTIEAALLDW